MNKYLKIILLGIIIMQCSCQSEPVDIQLNLEKGKEYTQNMTSKFTTIVEVTGQKMNIAITIKGQMSYLVENVSDTAYYVTVRFNKLSMALQSPVGTVIIDSESTDEDDFISEGFKQIIVDKPFYIILLKNGKISSVDMNDFWENSENAITDDMLPEQREQFIEQMKQAFGENAFKGSIEQVTAIFPDKSVRKGEKWQIQIELNSNFSGTMISEYELAAIKEDCFIIKGTSTISTNGLKDAVMPSSGGKPMKFDVNGTATSEIKIDKNTGWIIESSVIQTIKGKGVIDGMEIPIEMIGDTQITK
jgi:hypothetical protein